MFFKENSPIEIIRMGRAAAAAASDTLDGAAGVSCFDGHGIRMTNSAHGWYAGSTLEIGGTTNYDGMRYLRTVATNYMYFDTPIFTAETFTTSDYVYPWIYFGKDFYWQLLQFEIHLSAVSATSENLTLTRDANKGTYWDTTLYTKDMNGVTDVLWTPGPVEGPIFEPKDRLKLAWTNTNTKNWGATFYIRREK